MPRQLAFQIPFSEIPVRRYTRSWSLISDAEQNNHWQKSNLWMRAEGDNVSAMLLFLLDVLSVK